MDCGTLLYIPNYQFSDGTTRDKYFLILKNIEQTQLIISLPTSKDYVPAYETIEHGCIEIKRAQQTTYCFEPGRTITDCGFSFPLTTFLYGHLIDQINLEAFFVNYPVLNVHYEIIGKLTEVEHNSIVECFLKSCVVKRKYKRILEK